MEVLETVVIIIIILIICGVIGYFVYMYIQDKNAIEAQINSTSTQLQNKLNNEQSNRLSNIKYVVDQVNSVNRDISTKFSASNTQFLNSINEGQKQITANLSLQQKQHTQMSNQVTGLQSNTNTNNISMLNAGFGNYITLGNPSGTNSYNLLNLPGSPPPNMNIMKQVNLLMGLTAHNLSPAGGSNINFCYGPGNTHCTSFPNSDGDTVISAAPTSEDKNNTYSFTQGRTNKIVLNGPTNINGETNIKGDTNIDGETSISKNISIVGNSSTFGDSATLKDSVTLGNVTTLSGFQLCNAASSKCVKLSLNGQGNIVSNSMIETKYIVNADGKDATTANSSGPCVKLTNAGTIKITYTSFEQIAFEEVLNKINKQSPGLAYNYISIWNDGGYRLYNINDPNTIKYKFNQNTTTFSVPKEIPLPK